MLDLNKEKVEFLVNPNMVTEVNNYLETRKHKINDLIEKLIQKDIKNIIFIGCGSSNAVGTTLKYILDKYSSLNNDSYSGYEFINNTPKTLNKDSIVILTSHSGTTKEIEKSLKISKKIGALTIGNTKSMDNNYLGENADIVLDYQGEAGWVCQLLGLYLIFCNYIKQKENNELINTLLEDLPKVPKVLEELISNTEKEAHETAKKVKDWKGFYTIADGPLYPLAYKVGVVSNMEFAWAHGSAIKSSEFSHGPIEIVEKGTPFVFLTGTDKSREITKRIQKFVKSKDADSIEFDYEDYSNGLHEDLSPIMLYVPLEWFSYYYAIENDHNPDNTRYYGNQEL